MEIIKNGVSPDNIVCGTLEGGGCTGICVGVQCAQECVHIPDHCCDGNGIGYV